MILQKKASVFALFFENSKKFIELSPQFPVSLALKLSGQRPTYSSRMPRRWAKSLYPNIFCIYTAALTDFRVFPCF